MNHHWMSFVSGLLFALGLGLGGMTLPENIIGFLDFTGEWQPSLLAVMAGAVGTYSLLLPLVLKRGRPVLAERFMLPTRLDLDPRLISGAALFGIGWGLSGYCPGPAVASLATLSTPTFIFFGAMLSGMLLFQLYDKLHAAAQARLATIQLVPTESTR